MSGNRQFLANHMIHKQEPDGLWESTNGSQSCFCAQRKSRFRCRAAVFDKQQRIGPVGFGTQHWQFDSWPAFFRLGARNHTAAEQQDLIVWPAEPFVKPPADQLRNLQVQLSVRSIGGGHIDFDRRQFFNLINVAFDDRFDRTIVQRRERTDRQAVALVNGCHERLVVGNLIGNPSQVSHELDGLFFFQHKGLAVMIGQSAAAMFGKVGSAAELTDQNGGVFLGDHPGLDARRVDFDRLQHGIELCTPIRFFDRDQIDIIFWI